MSNSKYPSQKEDDPAPDPQREEQLFPTDICHFCYASPHAYQFFPCGHLAGCVDCVKLLVTKTFTEDVASHRCIFCSRPIGHFFHLESQETITTLRLQAEFPFEMIEEKDLRENEYKQYIEDIVDAQERADALGIYDVDDEEDDYPPERHDFYHVVVQDFAGHNHVLNGSSDQMQQIVNSIRNQLNHLAQQRAEGIRVFGRRGGDRIHQEQKIEERMFALQAAREEIEGELDYVPSSDDDDDDEEHDDVEEEESNHAMLTRSQVNRINDSPPLSPAAAPAHPPPRIPLTRRRTAQMMQDENRQNVDEEERAYNLRRRVNE